MVKANGIDYPAGSWVIPMDQPFSPMAKELFERQKYPDAARRDGTSKAVDLPYDVTGGRCRCRWAWMWMR